jgi:hypothetical protein
VLVLNVLPAAPCNKILAQPGTITGSIGVIFMKLNVGEALLEYGITGDAVSYGENADWTSSLHALTPKQQQQVREIRLLNAVLHDCGRRGGPAIMTAAVAVAAGMAGEASRVFISTCGAAACLQPSLHSGGKAAPLGGLGSWLEISR